MNFRKLRADIRFNRKALLCIPIVIIIVCISSAARIIYNIGDDMTTIMSKWCKN